MLDDIAHADPGMAAIADLSLTIAMSHVFIHEGLGLSS
jgi:hypothetical protein